MIPRAQLVRIIRPRVEEILEMVRDRLSASPFAADPRGRVILVGGASQLTGLADLASNILSRQVRIGPGSRVLVTAAAGGVGTAALQVARGLGATVLGAVGSHEKIETCRSLGAE